MNTDAKPGRLAGRVALITGAARGQGRAAALRFVSEGAQVFLTDIDADGLAESHALTEAAGGEVDSRVADVTAAPDVAALIQAVEARFGALHCLYNNHGAVSGMSIEDNTAEEWDRVYAVNTKSVFFLVQAALPLLRAAPSASVISVSSMAGVAGIRGGSVYGSSKGALVGLTVNLARELADDDIRVYCLLPGVVDTPMPRQWIESFPEDEREGVRTSMVSRQLFQRLAQPEEIVGVAAFLASSDASFMTGTVLPVDGGWLSW
jgi:NAD(P)-dependent dehydrogenase (short-subunit alcohol dehydrogenase family)